LPRWHGSGRIDRTYLGDGLIDALDGVVQLGIGELVDVGLRNGLQLGVERGQLLLLSPPCWDSSSMSPLVKPLSRRKRLACGFLPTSNCTRPKE
jgi:hypothetical protein